MRDMENKLTAAIAAMYWGAKFNYKMSDCDFSADDITMTGIQPNLFFGRDEKGKTNHYTISDCQLILKPLSEISDEDAIEVAKMVGLTSHYCKILRMQNAIFLNEDTYQFQISHNGYCCMRKNNVLYNRDIRKVYNFFRSKSYDIDNLIEQNIAITKLK